ncbi:hypothetical protein VTI74DRAFT_7854 [Chaetomium olivicolor]
MEGRKIETETVWSMGKRRWHREERFVLCCVEHRRPVSGGGRRQGFRYQHLLCIGSQTVAIAGFLLLLVFFLLFFFLSYFFCTFSFFSFLFFFPLPFLPPYPFFFLSFSFFSSFSSFSGCWSALRMLMWFQHTAKESRAHTVCMTIDGPVSLAALPPRIVQPHPVSPPHQPLRTTHGLHGQHDIQGQGIWCTLLGLTRPSWMRFFNPANRPVKPSQEKTQPETKNFCAC